MLVFFLVLVMVLLEEALYVLVCVWMLEICRGDDDIEGVRNGEGEDL